MRLYPIEERSQVEGLTGCVVLIEVLYDGDCWTGGSLIGRVGQSIGGGGSFDVWIEFGYSIHTIECRFDEVQTLVGTG